MSYEIFETLILKKNCYCSEIGTDFITHLYILDNVKLSISSDM